MYACMYVCMYVLVTQWYGGVVWYGVVISDVYCIMLCFVVLCSAQFRYVFHGVPGHVTPLYAMLFNFMVCNVTTLCYVKCSCTC